MFKKVGTTLALSAVLFSAFSSTGAISSASAATNVTSSYSSKMRSNALHMAYYAYEEKKRGTYPVGTGKEFAAKVKTGGPWDYKRVYKGTYTFNGKTSVKGEDLGNMHYGYVGRASGFSTSILKTAAGAYQIKSDTAKLKWYRSYFDDPKDQTWIKYGISLWNNNSLPKSKSLAVSSFNAAEEDATSLLSAPISFDELTDTEKEAIKEEVIKDSEAIKEEQANGTTEEAQLEDINDQLEETGVTVSN
ncbi:polymorphic toxin type 44 domain-containing protein [Priestia megaterium]